MVSFPSCKINLGLRVVSLRHDGYHDIETCFYPVPWSDILEIIPAGTTTYTFSGLSVPGQPEDNLCARAYHLLARDHDLPAIHLHLHKIIPLGSGLGGGSSDAAETLKLLNLVFGLGLSVEELRNCAAKLGSDCPFFVDPSPMIGTGRGEILSPAPIRLAGKFMVIVHPALSVSTASAYREVVPARPEKSLQEILTLPMAEWRQHLINDFESSVFLKYPAIGELKQNLYDLGAAYASMSGSGSSVYAIFEKPVDVHALFPGLSVWSGILF